MGGEGKLHTATCGFQVRLTTVPAVYPHINKAVNNILLFNITSKPEYTDPQSIDCRISRV